ncbi:MAG: M15 family metallopeptidase [Candidatus Paceibacterota bacterium]
MNKDNLSLREKQSEFVRKIAMLINYADINGYDLSFGDAYRDERVKYGSDRSLHRLRLAVDFNLFIDGVYSPKTEDYQKLGEYWESIGGSWGGRFNDGNHFSLEHNGFK